MHPVSMYAKRIGCVKRIHAVGYPYSGQGTDGKPKWNSPEKQVKRPAGSKLRLFVFQQEK